MRRDTVVVFARVPRLGTVKRRLARGVGERAALRFHAGTLARLLRGLRRTGLRVVLAQTPDRLRARWPVAVAGPTGGRAAPGAAGRVARMGQGAGDLGRRMDRAFRRLPCRRVALVGCDVPALGAGDLRACFRALGTAEAAFGPAEDGGYWLVAMGPRRPAAPFRDVRWSGEHALADTLRNFAGRRVALLRTLRDVDNPEDLLAWQASTVRSSAA